jgi:hypothetical protein
MRGFGSLKPWEGGAQAELKKAARLAGVGWRSLAAIDAGLEAFGGQRQERERGARRKAISGASNLTISLRLCVADFRVREHLRLISIT